MSFYSLQYHPVNDISLYTGPSFQALGPNVRRLDHVANGELDVTLDGIPHDGVRGLVSVLARWLRIQSASENTHVVRRVDVGAGVVHEVLEEESGSYMAC